MLTLPSGRKVVALDLVVVVWTLAWVVAGVAVGDAVAELTRLTGAFRSVGGAVTEVGATLGSVNLPLVGAPLDRASDAVTAAGRDIVARGQGIRGEIEEAATLIGAAVALIPILTLLLPYAPARLARASEAGALRRLLASRTRGDDVDFEAFLAERALNQVSYGRLVRVAERPWELEDSRTRRGLAEEELRRLGVSPRRLDGGRGRGG